MNTTVLLSPKVAHHEKRLSSSFPSVTFAALEPGGGLPSRVHDADVILRVALTKEELTSALTAAPGVRWVHTSTAGFDWAMVPAVERGEVTLTRSAASYAIPIGEFALSLITSMVKQFPALAEAQRRHRWSTIEPPEFPDVTVGIVGTGGIGREIAWRCRALGMRVLGIKRNPEPREHFDEVVGPDGLHALLGRVDVVVVACPLTDETRALIDADAFRSMREHAYLINVARGPIVQQEALLEALREGTIAGAAMDAFDEEPLPQDHPLWEAPNLIVTPHTSFKSPRILDRVMEEFEGNLQRFLDGKPLRNTLRDPALGY